MEIISMKHDGPDKFKRAHVTSTPQRKQTGLDDGPELPPREVLDRARQKIEENYPRTINGGTDIIAWAVVQCEKRGIPPTDSALIQMIRNWPRNYGF